jgi:hypothetical protein
MEGVNFRTPIILFLLCLLGLIIATSLSSCSTRKIYKKPTRREINRAMRNTPWEYKQPIIDATPKQF